MKKLAGFWAQRENFNDPNGFPFPVAREEPWEGQEEFLQKLKDIEKNSTSDSFRGISICRLCRCFNGAREYSNGDWRWPEGFIHYIKVHNVKPEQDFIDFINNLNI